MAASAEFMERVLGPTRSWMRRGIRAPTAVAWDVDGDTVVLRAEASRLAADIQTATAASPWYALCFAFWAEQRSGGRWRVRVEIEGAPPRADLAQWRRSGVLLRTMQAALPDRVEVHSAAPLPEFPADAVVNRALADRAGAQVDRGEKALEIELTRAGALADWLRAKAGPLQGGFQRQRPTGVFEGRVSKETGWGPRQGCQLDLWGRGADGRFHLFELKDHRKTQPLGIIPEALYYERVLRLEGETTVDVWLVAPEFHPLVWSEGTTPLSWLNEGLAAEGTTFRVLHLPAALWPRR